MPRAPPGRPACSRFEVRCGPVTRARAVHDGQDLGKRGRWTWRQPHRIAWHSTEDIADGLRLERAWAHQRCGCSLCGSMQGTAS